MKDSRSTHRWLPISSQTSLQGGSKEDIVAFFDRHEDKTYHQCTKVGHSVKYTCRDKTRTISFHWTHYGKQRRPIPASSGQLTWSNIGKGGHMTWKAGMCMLCKADTQKKLAFDEQLLHWSEIYKQGRENWSFEQLQQKIMSCLTESPSLQRNIWWLKEKPAKQKTILPCSWNVSARKKVMI